ncbi:hypothetical protein SLEP1_g52047 [Rubroshorea leprosula]|uniref:Uncharacterized protein n=1 Tax=Rubroshorea leprosula TaxID=152421 RepID=A0AAV5M7Q5_9ROSI|nr:hypothetical protein SLEP1_g52047 [Rubroshorea leprosula]
MLHSLSLVLQRQIKRKHDDGLVDSKPEKRASISPQRLEVVSPESNTIMSGGRSHVSFDEAATSECATNGDVDCNSVVRSLTEQADSGKGTLGFTNQLGKTVDCNLATLSKQTSLDVHEFSLVRNDVTSAEAVETIPSFIYYTLPLSFI